MKSRRLRHGFLFLLLVALVFWGTGCQTVEPRTEPAFTQYRPVSILVLPPVNQSMNVFASESLLAQVQFPLAEAGYYVLPVAMVVETFRQNGFTEPEAIRAIAYPKLRKIFGADAVLSLTILEAGTEYMVIASDTRVTAEAELRDLGTGALLWRGRATASSTEMSSASGGGLIGLLVEAVVEQVFNTATDRSHQIAGLTAWRLFHPDSPIAPPDGPIREEYLMSE
jgi:hypothetical protein